MFYVASKTMSIKYICILARYLCGVWSVNIFIYQEPTLLLEDCDCLLDPCLLFCHHRDVRWRCSSWEVTGVKPSVSVACPCPCISYLWPPLTLHTYLCGCSSLGCGASAGTSQGATCLHHFHQNAAWAIRMGVGSWLLEQRTRHPARPANSHPLASILSYTHSSIFHFIFQIERQLLGKYLIYLSSIKHYPHYLEGF